MIALKGKSSLSFASIFWADVLLSFSKSSGFCTSQRRNLFFRWIARPAQGFIYKNVLILFFQIAKIVSCEIIDTGKRLLQIFRSVFGSIVTVSEVHDEVVICKGENAACETFDGSLSKQIASTKTRHYRACMALFRNQPTIIAGYETATVETLAVR